MMSWLNYLFLSREVRWKWYGGLEEKGGTRREGGRDWEGKEERADNES